MRRKSTFFTLPSLFLLGVLFGGLGWTVWRGEGMIFSPGKLTAQQIPGIKLGGFSSHAEFEKECELCHQPLKTTQSQLCIECHNEIRQELSDPNGLHNKMGNVQQCFECHSDHKGMAFNPTTDALDKFDHSVTSFSLEWHQVNFDTTPMDCLSCHQQEPDFQVLIDSCARCHADHNADFMSKHILDFGENCLECHDGTDRMVNFDHSASAFPLTGAHLEVSCASCHQAGKFAGTATDCAQCHLEPEIHLGFFSTECSACHNTGAWIPAFYKERPFDHQSLSKFSLARHKLDFAGQVMGCKSCHRKDLTHTNLQTCVNCHFDNDQKFMQDHIDQFGNGCLDCHDGVDRLSNFDHNTVFALEGRHAEIDCISCHIDHQYKGTPMECVQCHAEPEIHAGFFGVQCEYCHSSSAWTPAKMTQHQFPLDHGSDSNVECETCHTNAYSEYTCYGCHEHQSGKIFEKHNELNLTDQELAGCVQCHPAGEKSEEQSHEDG
jgi:hypothetical protein